MPSIKDNILSQIPSHIVESYPRFLDFIAAYYEWLSQDENPYANIRDHLDYMTFEKTLDSYVEHMKNEYLTDIPDSVLLDKELFIKWSKDFNLARGSHESYKFLFKTLFNEQTTEIYVPKDNILKTSDGEWNSGESLIYVTFNANNFEQFQFQLITQTRPIYKDIVEVATASVQGVKTRYVGRYVVTELTLSGISGEFKEGFPIETELGASEWLIPVVNNVDITDSGSGHQIGQRILIDGMTTNEIVRLANVDGSFDTRITSFFNKNDATVYINDVATTNYLYDGRFIVSDDISQSDEIKVVIPAYQGYIVIDSIDESQGVKTIDILDLPIGKNATYTLSTDVSSSSFSGTPHFGLVKSVKGYYSGTKGQLSSNMYLQDSFFYQNYSYAIRTQQDFLGYADIVKQVLHPAGFLLFGQLSYLSVIELILQYQDDIEIPNTVQTLLPKYGLGGNYNFINRFKDKASIRLYRQSFFDALDQDYLNGEAGYDLESRFLADRIAGYEYPNKKGWMSKSNAADYFLYVPQEYTEETESGIQFFETGYVSTRTLQQLVVNFDTIIVS
jgi:hypothetical protein